MCIRDRYPILFFIFLVSLHGQVKEKKPRTFLFGLIKFDTESEYEEEQSRVKQMLEIDGASPGKEHLLEFLEEWERLQGN